MNQAFFVLISSVFCFAKNNYVPFSVANIPWKQELGNHRACIRIKEKSNATLVHIPWRRRDLCPQDKNIIVIDSSTGERINNVLILEIKREYGDIVFQPKTAPGEYEIYYMPYNADAIPWAYNTKYLKFEDTADPIWRDSISLQENLHKAEVIEIQARTEFDRFDPMEVIATESEVDELLQKYDNNYLLFPEDRKHPIRMKDYIPFYWIEKGPSSKFNGLAFRGEFYVFQVGVFAAKKSIEDISITFHDIKSDDGQIITGDLFKCFNKGGIDWLGRPFEKLINIESGKVGALWFGLQIQDDVKPGTYSGKLTIKPKDDIEANIDLSLYISDKAIENHGDNELWRHSRLRWLDSTIAINDEITDPYIPLKLDNKSIECLGRKVTFGENGLPESIISGINEILHKPISFLIETFDSIIQPSNLNMKTSKITPGTIILESDGKMDQFNVKIQTKMEFDGYVNFRIELVSKEETKVKDIKLEIPIKLEIAKYMMGMGYKGGYRRTDWQWVWDEKLANNCIWIGDVNAGLYCKLKGSEDIWELYSLKASGVPKSWNNEGKGGCHVFTKDNAVIFKAYSGERIIKNGEKLEFCFSLLITPLKPLNPSHWNQRYYHAYVPIEAVKGSGANIVNIHHGNEINPNINYPFIAVDKMAKYIEEAHENNIKVKIYYTIRELSNYVVELWALRSLGTEVFVDGSGGGHSWLCEHLVSNYCPAWHHVFSDTEVDAAIATTGLSRWHNYYLEGLKWLIKNVGIDGLYLDGIGYDREIMKRVRKVMDSEKSGCLIDFHSGNNFHPNYGLSNCATQYMEHFPYIDSLWFGEGFDYNETPDYWLVEVSGIPFGLFGEMLQDNGNPWRGMIYGMTNRLGWGGDPRNIWKVWDDFGIQESKMIGYWDETCPIKTSDDNVLATVYLKEKKALVSLASWSDKLTYIRLNVNWQTLGIDQEKAKLTAPEIPGFQSFATFYENDTIPVEPGKGWLIFIE
ncbi:MAG: glycoside hydrolase domain-containing protein [bacterium]